jgi:hypothetical protein
MPAEIRISHFGDVMMDHSFTDAVVFRFGNEMQKRKFHHEVRRYSELFLEPKDSGPIKDLFDADFNDAWLDEFGFMISDNHSYRSTTIRITGVA